jgi:RNA polymerase sigma-70 factor (ECF subfamily)
LVSRILAGDHEACVRLVHLHHATVYRLLVRLCGDPILAEDLTQETFAAAWVGMSSFVGASSLGTWLHRIAYRKSVDAGRRKAHPLDHSEGAVDRLCSATRDPAQEAIAEEQSLRLQRALEKLPPAERDVVVLHYLQGLSFREMAEVLGEPAGTVKWRTGRALERLRTFLGNQRENETGQTASSRNAGPRGH